jgi:hypothetical protein
MAQTRLSQIGQINDVIGCPCLGLALAALAALAAPAGAVERQASPHNRRYLFYCPAQQARQAQNSAQPNQAPHHGDESRAAQRILVVLRWPFGVSIQGSRGAGSGP